MRGPFSRWRHRHLVLPDRAGARLRDELEYELPGGSLAPLLDLVLRPLLGRMFAYRHAITRRSVSAASHVSASVTTSGGLLQYDTLVLAPGSRTDYRGVPGAAEYSLPLRTLEDTLRLREKVGTHLGAWEHVRELILNFVRP